MELQVGVDVVYKHLSFPRIFLILNFFLRINRTFVISATSSMLFKPQIEYIYKDYFLDPERKQDRKAHGER